MTTDAASPAVRVAAALVGVAFCFVGGAVLFNAAQALWSLVTQLLSAGVYTPRDALYVLVWTVFSASLLAAGLSLVYAALRARRYNMVPGPTLYFAGASLLVISFFLTAAAAPLYALVAAAFGISLLVAEYSSEIV
ncbi:MAG: hypothetical protein AB8G16_10940 [Gammaproteobacteria bacterium]